MAAWHIRAVELPDGSVPMDWWIVDGRLTMQPAPDAVRLPDGYLSPGLVDAHVHVTMDMVGSGLPQGSAALVEAHADLQLRAGVTAVRDVGLVPGTTAPEHARGMTILQSGYLLVPTGHFHEGLAAICEPDQAVAAVGRAVDGGARWIKIIGDFPGPDWNWFAAAPTYPVDVVEQIVETAHAGGARVAAHTSSPYVAELIRAGIDSIEHGPLVTVDLVDEMADRGTAWVPTLSTVVAKHLDPLTEGDTAIAGYLRSVYAELERALARAVERGVPVLAGTDERAPGSIALEIAQLRRFGLSGRDALAAASSVARDYLGFRGLVEGAPADCVLFRGDPREVPETLARPVAVFAQGALVAAESPQVAASA